MKNVVAVFAFLALSSAYANQSGTNTQETQQPSAAATEQTKTQDHGVIKKKKATTEEETKTQEAGKADQKSQEQGQQH